jgi:ABC-type transport system involved in cytochrome bd biosynthesis fused ATPase/permease subunit
MTTVKKPRRQYKKALARDIGMILLGAIIALVFVHIGLLDFFLSSLRGYVIVASFVAGVFFTSAFTLAPASIALVGISQYAPMSTVAHCGEVLGQCVEI